MSETSIVKISIGPLPNKQPGITVFVELSNGTSVPAYLMPTQAKELVDRINDTLRTPGLTLSSLLRP